MKKERMDLLMNIVYAWEGLLDEGHRPEMAEEYIRSSFLDVVLTPEEVEFLEDYIDRKRVEYMFVVNRKF